MNERVFNAPLSLGDVTDAEAYVRPVVAKLGIHGEDARDAIMVGVTHLAFENERLPAGTSLKGKAGGIVLEHRLIDWLRKQRHLSPGGESLGLPWDDDGTVAHPVATATLDPAAYADARETLSHVQGWRDLRKPHVVARALGVSSAAAVGTAAAKEILEDEAAERSTFHL